MYISKIVNMKKYSILFLVFLNLLKVNAQVDFNIAQVEENVSNLLNERKYDLTKQKLNDIRLKKWNDLSCKEQAIVYRLFGNLHYHLYEDAKALKYYSDSSYQKVIECNATDLENDLLNNIGSIYQFEGKQLLASKYYNKLRLNYLSGGSSSTKKACQHLKNLAYFYDTYGDLYNSFLCAWKAKQIAESLNLKIGDIYNSLGIYFERTKQYQEALNNYSKAIEISLAENEKIPVSFLYNQALTYRYMKQYDKALEILEQLESQKSTDNAAYNILNLKALIYTEQGKYEASEKIYMQLDKDENKKIRKLSHYENWADLKLKKGNISEAIKIYKKRIENIQSKWSHLNNIPTSSSDLLELTELKCLLSKALYLSSQKENQKSQKEILENYTHIQNNVEQIVNSNWESQSSSHLLNEIYSNLYYFIRCHLDNYEITKNPKSIEEAYQILSVFKNQILEREIKSRKQLKESLADTILSKYYKLKSKINLQYAEKDLEEKSKIQLIEKFENYQLKFDSILNKENSLVSLKPKSLKESQNNLNKNDALLDIYFAEEKLICFWLTNHDIQINSTSLPNYILKEFIENVKTGKQISQSTNDEIYNALFSNLQIDGIENIIVHADGLFQKLPFGAIKDPKSNTYLIENISFRYILSTDSKYTENYSWTGDKCLGIASDYKLNLGNEMKTPEMKFGELTGTIDEIVNLFNYYKTDTLINDNASFHNFSDQIINEDYNIVQLSLHGILDDRFPALSGLIFENESNVELIDLNKITGLNFNTDLTIVNSCHSGDGTHITGEAMSNLNTSLFISGSKANIVNLWSSSDKASSEILINFHEEISNGKTKSEALQLAKIKYLNTASPSFKHPKYWSSLVLFGNNTPKKKNKLFSPIYLILGLFLATFLFFFIKRLK